MLTPEQKERLEELRSKDELNVEDQSELAKLEKLEPADSEQDDFDDAWENDNFDESESDSDADADEDTDSDQEDEEEEENEDQSTKDGDDQDSDSDSSSSPEDESDTSDTDDDEDEEEPEDDPAAMVSRLSAENAKLKQRMASWDGRIRAAEKKAEEAERKLKGNKEGQGASDTASLTDDDPELSDFFQEFPDLEGPITKVAEKIATKIVENRIGSVEETVGTVQDTLEEESNTKHRKAIIKAHPDFENIVESGALETWIAKQPTMLQPRYNDIVASGSTEEIIEMFDSYKKSARVKSSSNTPSSDTSKGKGKSKKNQRKKNIEAVPASSNGPRVKGKGPAKDDFDGAWDHFTKEEKKKK
jgi:hypothetical protein